MQQNAFCGVCLSNMESSDTDRLHRLRPGQLWKVEHGYVYIVELGKRIILYKMLRHPSVMASVTQMIRIEALLNYLRQSEAQLTGSDTPVGLDAMPAAFAA